MTSNEIPERLAKYKAEIERLRTALDLAFGVGVANEKSAPEDIVVFPLGVAARDHPETWKDYLDTMHAQWAKILQNVPEAARTLPVMHNELLEKVPKYGSGKFISLDWNKEGNTYEMASDVGISEQFHSLAFNYSSAFVHPSAMFFLHRLSRTSEDSNRLMIGTKSDDQEWRMAMQIAHDLIINAIRLRVKYSESKALRESLEICEKDFSNIWGYQPQAVNIREK